MGLEITHHKLLVYFHACQEAKIRYADLLSNIRSPRWYGGTMTQDSHHPITAFSISRPLQYSQTWQEAEIWYIDLISSAKLNPYKRMVTALRLKEIPNGNKPRLIILDLGFVCSKSVTYFCQLVIYQLSVSLAQPQLASQTELDLIPSLGQGYYCIQISVCV